MRLDHCGERARLRLACALAVGTAFSGCAEPTPPPAAVSARSAPPASMLAVAELRPTRGNTAAGTVSLVQEGDRVVFMTQIRGLKPNQEHGFHVHEKGDCSSPDAMSAGDLLGKALVVHAERDDYMTQPTGNSGSRIACGVVMAPTT
jgi:superoxide dismutase, Cu-Zn family